MNYTHKFRQFFFKMIKFIILLFSFSYKINIPNNKKYLIYIKIAKTGSSTIIEYFKYNTGIITLREFEKLSVNDKQNISKLIIVVNDQIEYFTKNYSYIWDNSYKFSCVRNPISRFESALNYHPYCKGNDPIHLINSLLKYKKLNVYDWKKKYDDDIVLKISAYNHLLYSQYDSLYIDKKKIYDYLLRIEDFDNSFNTLLKSLNLKFYFKHLYKKRVNKSVNKKTLTEKEIVSIIKIFEKDFLHFNYQIY